MCIIIAFNYAGCGDNGKLLIGTFPNESDDGESRVYKLIYLRALVILILLYGPVEAAAAALLLL